MVMVLQPMTANLALCLAAAPVVRTFMKPPRTSPQVAAISGARHHEPAPGRNAPRPVPAPAEDSSPETATAINVKPPDSTDNR